MADPVISSAILTGSTLAIVGSNFGTKATAAPYFFQPYTDLLEGDTPTDAGFDSWENRGGEVVTLADGVGGGSLRCDPEAANNAFPLIGKYLPDGNQEINMVVYSKIYGTSASIRQLKFGRSGKRSYIAPQDDYDSTDGKYYPHFFIYDGGVIGENSFQFAWRTAAGEVDGALYPDEAGYGSSGIAYSAAMDVDFKEWNTLELYLKNSSVGLSDGAFRGAVNNFVWFDRNAVPIRTDSAEDLSFIQPFPNLDLPVITEYDYAMSRISIDVGPDCRALVFFSDSSTLAGVTRKFVLPPTAWAGTTIAASDAANIPTGYNYAYVTNAAGETNSTGYAYTTGGGSFNPAWARNSNQVIIS